MSKGPNYPIEAYKSPGLAIVAGTFQANGTNAPDVLTGKGFTVAHADVGKFTITFADTFKRCVAFVCSIGETGDDTDRTVHQTEIDLTTGFSSISVYTTVGSTDTDTDNQQVSFIAVMSTSNTNLERAS